MKIKWLNNEKRKNYVLTKKKNFGRIDSCGRKKKMYKCFTSADVETSLNAAKQESAVDVEDDRDVEEEDGEDDEPDGAAGDAAQLEERPRREPVPERGRAEGQKVICYNDSSKKGKG